MSDIPQLSSLIINQHKRTILRSLNPNQAHNFNIEINQENFDIAVEEGNINLVQNWKQYGFTVSELHAVRSSNPAIMDLIDDFSEYSSDGYNPVMEEVAIRKNMNYLRRFVDSFSSIPPEFTRFGWTEGIVYLIERNIGINDIDFIIENAIEAINSERWDLMRLFLSFLSPEELANFKKELRDGVWVINNSSYVLNIIL